MRDNNAQPINSFFLPTEYDGFICLDGMCKNNKHYIFTMPLFLFHKLDS